MKYITIYLYISLIISLFTNAFSQQVLPPDDGAFHYYQSDTLDNDLKSLRKSFYGNRIAPEGEFRILNLFINIIYDQTGQFDPIKNPNEVWSPDTIEGINRESDIPNYLEQFMDVEYLPAGGFGSMTRLYRESSFDNLILLGDFVVANIKQSRIPKTYDTYFGYSMHTFSLTSLINEAIQLINESGGLNTLFGYNQISDYDIFTPSLQGLPKPMVPNDQIDFLQILIRNTTFIDTTFVQGSDTITYRLRYGGLKSGSGFGNRKPSIPLRIGNNFYYYDLGTVQCVGHSDISRNANNIVHHEFSHNLFGGNTFHTSGGNHYLGGGTNTWFGTEGGYGLMGAANSGLTSCNGYERWRMHWTSPVYNPEGYLIQANGVPADISRDDGPQSFVLRDFVTTGDAIRIKLPYIDQGASNQYIWLENHQIGNNNKLDYLNFSVKPDMSIWWSCRPLGTPGIYSYIQVGKDILEGTSAEVYPDNETDNLRIISSEGNWDFLKLADEHISCVRGGSNTVGKRISGNPLSGHQDQTLMFFNPDSLKLHGSNDKFWLNHKYDHNNNILSDGLPFLGDELDAFTGNSQMSIGTNPSPANFTTYYVTQNSGNFQDSNANTNTSHIYLSGLRIDMKEKVDGTFEVDIVWDDYEVKNDVRWAGNIVLKEKVILKENYTIELDQSLTPNQIYRDPISGEFAPPTVFTCKEGSEFILEEHSELVLKNHSSLVLESGSSFEIGNHSILTVNQGDTLKIEPCAKLIIKGTGKLKVKDGGVLCISEGAIVATDFGHSNLSIHNNAVIPNQCINPSDIVPATTIIYGSSSWINENYHVNTITILDGGHLTISNSEIVLGDKSSKVIIKKGGKLEITNNSILTNSCGDYWQGIYVEGDRNLSQTFENQGALILENGAIIENARHAVLLRGVDHNWHYNGGIIQATDATFRNNFRDVGFGGYLDSLETGELLDNISFFTNCEFITDDDTPHNTHIQNVTMWRVTGVRFTNCTFKDDRGTFDNGSIPSRKGIYSINSSFRVWGCEFENMKYGIYAYATEANQHFSVLLSDFSSYRGIYFNAKDNVTIMNNTFNVTPGYDYPGSSCGDTYGIYINNSASFAIENNHFESDSDGATHCGSLGIIARNTGALTNEIYRNDFVGFTVGIEALGHNRGASSHQGLELRCNRNWENAFDFFVTTDISSVIQQPNGIRALQGNPFASSSSMLAGNIFTNNSTFHVSNFVNTEANISYFHHNLSSEPNVVPDEYFDSNTISLHLYGYNYSYDVSCPEQLVPKFYFELQEERNAAIALYSETKLLYESYVDDGNTELMTQQVEMTGDGDAYTSYLYLMQTSPYLSEEVLSTLSAKEEGFNKAMIRDVLVENPQSAKSEEVNLALDNRLDPLPAYMRWQINNGLYQFSEMEVMRHFMAYQKTRHDRALNRILGGIIRNEEGFENAPPIEDILADIDDIRYQYMLAEWLFGKGDFAQGMQLLGQIEQDFDLSDEALWYAHEDKLSFYNWLAQWDQEEYPGYFGLPEDALQELEAYLDATPRVAGKALSLLMLNEAIEYEEPILYPIMHLNSEPIHHETMPIISEMDEEFSFSLFPNPSKEYITLDWCFDSPQMTGIIEIRNSKGVLMDVVKTEIHCNQRIYPLTHLKSGSYTATLISGSYIRKTLSFIVIK